MRRLSYLIILLLIQSAFADDVGIIDEYQAALTTQGDGYNLLASSPSLDDPDTELFLPTLLQPLPDREPWLNSTAITPCFPITSAFLPRGPPSVFFV